MTDRQQETGTTGEKDGADHPAAGLGPVPAPVLHLSDFGHVQPGRIMAEMRAYWKSLRRGRAIPARADIEPQGIRRALDHAFILERIAPGAARFRLAGRHLIDLMGMEVRGMPICAFANPSSRGRLSDVLESVFKAPQIAELRLLAPAEYARPALSARMLLLPLRSDLGDVTRALGCLIAEGEIGVAPRRFDLAEDSVSPVVEGGTTLAPSPSAAGFAEPAPKFRRSGARRAPIAALPPPARDAKAGDARSETGRSGKGPQATEARLPADPTARRAMFRLVSRDGPDDSP